MKRINVCLVSDCLLARETMACCIAATHGLSVVAELGVSAFCHEPDLAPATAHVVLLDMDGSDPENADIGSANGAFELTPVVLLSALVQERYVNMLASGHVRAYLTKLGTGADELAHALRLAGQDEPYFSADVRARVTAATGKRDDMLVARLSKRELDVLRQIAIGLSKKEIAAHLCISIKTVETFSSRLMHKLGIHDRVELARYAIREGLVNP